MAQTPISHQISVFQVFLQAPDLSMKNFKYFDFNKTHRRLVIHVWQCNFCACILKYIMPP